MEFWIIAGGEKAFVKAVEGAEDSSDLGRSDLEKIHLTKKDFVIRLVASGRTSYVLEGLVYAKSMVCHMAAISCNKGSLIGGKAELAIEVITGPEVLTGYTYLKAGTAQKLVINIDFNRCHGRSEKSVSKW